MFKELLEIISVLAKNKQLFAFCIRCFAETGGWLLKADIAKICEF